MFSKTYLDEYGYQVENLVNQELGACDKPLEHFWRLEQYGDAVSPRVTLRTSPGTFYSFVIGYEHQVLSTSEELRQIIRRFIKFAYRLSQWPP